MKKLKSTFLQKSKLDRRKFLKRSVLGAFITGTGIASLFRKQIIKEASTGYGSRAYGK